MPAHLPASIRSRVARPLRALLSAALLPLPLSAQGGAPPAKTAAPASAPAACPAGASAATPSEGWTRWGGDVANTRYRRTGLARGALAQLEVAWAFSLGEVTNARSQPVVAGGTVFVGSEAARVVALDLERGCTRWSAKTEMPVRSGLVVGVTGGDSLVWFGDLAGTVHALDARTGERRWKRRVDPHFAAIITGTPQLFQDVLYVPVSSYESAVAAQPNYACCTFRGSVVALDARTGAPRWQTFMISDTASPQGKTATGTAVRGPSGVAVWSTPTIDSTLGRLYIGTGNNYSDPPSAMSDAIVALELATGRIAWAKQFTARDAYHVGCDLPGKPNCPTADGPDHDFGQPPILVTLPGGGRRLLAAQKSGAAHALDPDRDGAVVWTRRVGDGGRLGGPHWGSATDGRLWWIAIGGQQIIPVPDSTVKEGYRLEPDPTKGGGLVALDVATGAERWRAEAPSCAPQGGSGKRVPAVRPKCSPAQSAPVTAIGDVVLSPAIDGIVRAYDAQRGAVVWRFDTAREYPAINGGTARGGAIDVAGPVIAGRTVLLLSGYGQYGGRGGNVLLALRRPGGR